MELRYRNVLPPFFMVHSVVQVTDTIADIHVSRHVYRMNQEISRTFYPVWSDTVMAVLI